MALEKHAAYLNMPFSVETPSEGFHSFLTVSELASMLTQNRCCYFLCRAVGTMTSEYGKLFFHEIEDSSVKVYLSLDYAKVKPQYLTLPYAVHICGFAHWEPPYGPVVYAQTICPISSYLAFRLRSTMRWAIDTYFSTQVINNNIQNPVIANQVTAHQRHLARRALEEREKDLGIRPVRMPLDIELSQSEWKRRLDDHFAASKKDWGFNERNMTRCRRRHEE